MDLIRGRILKPRRILYYIIPTDEEITAFYEGQLPEKLERYNGAFGTYDHPSLFIMDKNSAEEESICLLGIEFRPDDDRISYPDDLAQMELPQAFFTSSYLPDDMVLRADTIDDIVEKIVERMQSVVFVNGGFKPASHADLIQVVTYNHNNQILVRSGDVSETEFFHAPVCTTETEKKLYDAAYYDPISQHHNWKWIWPIISGYSLKGLQDFQFVHMDIKDFNAINVVYGHRIANNVLRRLARLMDAKDWVYYSARGDNDDFAMMIRDMPEEETREKLLVFLS